MEHHVDSRYELAPTLETLVAALGALTGWPLRRVTDLEDQWARRSPLGPSVPLSVRVCGARHPDREAFELCVGGGGVLRVVLKPLSSHAYVSYESKPAASSPLAPARDAWAHALRGGRVHGLAAALTPRLLSTDVVTDAVVDACDDAGRQTDSSYKAALLACVSVRPAAATDRILRWHLSHARRQETSPLMLPLLARLAGQSAAVGEDASVRAAALISEGAAA